jgi:hypothetical protein
MVFIRHTFSERHALGNTKTPPFLDRFELNQNQKLSPILSQCGTHTFGHKKGVKGERVGSDHTEPYITQRGGGKGRKAHGWQD